MSKLALKARRHHRRFTACRRNIQQRAIPTIASATRHRASVARAAQAQRQTVVADVPVAAWPGRLHQVYVRRWPVKAAHECGEELSPSSRRASQSRLPAEQRWKKSRWRTRRFSRKHGGENFAATPCSNGCPGGAESDPGLAAVQVACGLDLTARIGLH